MAAWDQLRVWLASDGVAWTQWAQIGDIDVENATLVLERFGIAPTKSARARLRREVDVATFDPVPIRPWWNDEAAAMREP